MSTAKVRSVNESYDELETQEGDVGIEKARDNATRDFIQIKQIRDMQGVI